jgi:hypothetical protein
MRSEIFKMQKIQAAVHQRKLKTPYLSAFNVCPEPSPTSADKTGTGFP